MAEEGGQETVGPDAGSLLELFRSLPRHHVVLMDCMDYLESRIGEKEILKVIQDIRDIAYRKSLIVIFSLDTETVSDNSIKRIAKETRDMLPCESLPKLSEKHTCMVEFVGKANAKNQYPTYSEVGETLGLSKPTVRTRVAELKEMALLDERPRGRTKQLELTQKGKDYMAQ
jgi:hypothetical protein